GDRATMTTTLRRRAPSASSSRPLTGSISGGRRRCWVGLPGSASKRAWRSSRRITPDRGPDCGTGSEPVLVFAVGRGVLLLRLRGGFGRFIGLVGLLRFVSFEGVGRHSGLSGRRILE